MVARAFADQLFTPNDVWLWRTAGDPQIRSDGRMIVYTEEFSERDRDARFSNLWIASADSKDRRAWTKGAWRDTSPRWSPDGAYIAWLSDRAGMPQIYVRSVTGEASGVSTTNELVPLTLAWSP